MTATSLIRNELSSCVDITKRTNAFSYRSGNLKDIEPLAELFRTVYGDTTHPCQSPSYIRGSLISGQQQWFVVELDAIIIGCCCIARRPWNISWEICHGVIHPAARRTGAISSLVQLALDSHKAEPSDLGFYVTRNIASHAMMLKIRPGVLVGHDGGPDTVDGIREYHLTALLPPAAKAAFKHLSPWYVNVPGAEVIGQHLYQALQLDVQTGAYPSTCLGGPASSQAHGRVLFAHDPQGQTLMVSGQAGDYPTQGHALAEVVALLGQYAEVRYASVVVLADKLELIAGLIGLGFSITAYLPAWHVQGGTRFDCIHLVLQTFDQRPRSHGFDNEVAFFDEAYARLADRLCSLRLTQGHA